MRTIKTISLILYSFIIVLMAIIFLLFSLMRDTDRVKIISPIVQSVSEKGRQIRSIFTSGIEKVVNKSLDQSQGIYSIVVINLKTHEIYSQNPDRVYESASLYKLWVMAATYQKLHDGKLKKSNVLTDSVQDLNSSFNIASNEAELTEGKITHTVNDAIEQSITVSDNYSALLLTKQLGVSALDAFLKKEGLIHSETGSPPTTTAADIALFYTKLYYHQLVDKQSSDEMLDLLKKQAINDRIPKYLPKEITIAHKTGELDNFKHDAGIVFTPKGDYILVMLSETNDPHLAAEKMAELSKQIYLHFTAVN